MDVLFLTECYSFKGFGHLSRCLNFAQKARELDFETRLFIKTDIKEEVIEFFKINDIKQQYFIIEWDINKSIFLASINVIDSYEVDAEQFIKDLDSKIFLIFDDDKRYENLALAKLPNLYFLDIPSNYKIKHENIFSSLEYALIKKEFTPKDTPYKYKYFVSFGGSDEFDFSYKIISLLGENFKIALILGSNYKGALKSSNLSKNIDLYINVENKQIASLMQSSRFGILSSSTLSLEALGVNLPCIIFCLAKNQEGQFNYLIKNKLALCSNLINFKSDLDALESKESDLKQNMKSMKISSKISSLLSTLYLKCLNMSIKQKKIFEDYDFKDLKAKNFCNLSSKELNYTLNYRNAPFVREQMYSYNLISLKGHLNFVQTLKDVNTSFYFLVKKQGDDLGVISFSRINKLHKFAYIGLYKNWEAKKAGILLLELICFIGFKKLGLRILYLEVLEDNTLALSLYKKFGFKYCGTLKECFLKDGFSKDVLIFYYTNKDYK